MQAPSPAQSPDWKSIRKEFPALDRITYLNSAGPGPVCRAAAEAGSSYYQRALEHTHVRWADWSPRIEEIRARTADFIGTSPKNIAFLPNSSLGVNYIAEFLGGPLEVVMSADEFPSCSYPFLHRGHKVHFVPSGESGVLAVDELMATVSPSTTAVLSSHVQYSTGYRQDIKQLGERCRERKIAFVINATQSAGVVPFHVQESKADFAVFTTHKWFAAGCGVSVLYVSDPYLQPSQYPSIGWRSAKIPYKLQNDLLILSENAEALELGHPLLPNQLAYGAALDFIRSIGVAQIAERVHALTEYLHRRADRENLKLLSPRLKEQRAGITILETKDAEAVGEELRKAGVIVTARNNGIRVSINYYNNETDIDRCVDAYLEIVKRQR